jgi:hypothetical protein
VKAPLVILLALLTGCSHEATPPFVRPKAILLIRHAEKPADDADIHLSPEGKKRADALPDLFKKTDTRPDPFPTPDFIIATKASKHSNRPVETVTPLAKALKLEVDATYANDDYPNLVEKLYTTPKYEGKTVLICWHHGTLPGVRDDARRHRRAGQVEGLGVRPGVGGDVRREGGEHAVGQAAAGADAGGREGVR